MNTLHVKKGDTVVVLSGKQKGKSGKIISVNPKKGQVVIEGVNMLTTHVKPRRQGAVSYTHLTLPTILLV